MVAKSLACTKRLYIATVITLGVGAMLSKLTPLKKSMQCAVLVHTAACLPPISVLGDSAAAGRHVACIACLMLH